MDWTKSDAQLGRETGRSRQRLNQIRKSLGVPSNNATNRSARAKLLFDSGHSVETIAQMMGVQPRTIETYLRPWASMREP